MRSKQEQAHFFISMILLAIAIVGALSQRWDTFAPALIGAMGYWLAMAEVYNGPRH